MSHLSVRTFLLMCLLLMLTPLGAQEKKDLPGIDIVGTFKGHSELVYAVAFSKDGTQLATGSFDNTIKLWQVATGKELATLGGPQGHQKMVLSVAISPDGLSLASGSADNTLKIWDIPSDKPIRNLANNEAINAIALSPDGTKLAGACKDGAVKIWSAGDFKLLSTLTGHIGPVTGVAFSQNGQILASCGSDKTIRFWNAANGQPTGVIGAHKAAVTGIALSPNNAIAYSIGEDGFLKFWPTAPAASRPIANLPSAIKAFVASADGNQILSTGEDMTVRITGVANKDSRALSAVKSPIKSVAASGNGIFVAAGGADGKVFLWSAKDSKLLADIFGHAGGTGAVAFHPKSSMLMTGGDDGLLKIWALPVRNAPLLGILKAHNGPIVSIQYNADGTQALTAGKDNVIKLWDLRKASVVRTFGPVKDAIRVAAFNRDFTQVGVAAGNSVKVWSAGDGKELLNLAHPAEVTAFSFSNDKTRIATGAADKNVRLWDTANGLELQFFPQAEVVAGVTLDPKNIVIAAAGKAITAETPSLQRQIAAGQGPLQAVALTPPAAHILTGGADKLVKIWNTANGNNERSIPTAGDVKAIAIAKNNILTAIATGDKAVRFFVFGDGKEMGAVKAQAVIKALVFSPNNAFVSGAGADKSISAWNVTFAPGQPLPPEFLRSLQSFAHTESATDVVFAPDNSTIYSSSIDKSIRAWRLASPSPTKNFPHPNHVDVVAFHPTQPIIASGGHDGKVRVFDLVKGNQIREINAHSVKEATMIYALAFSPDGKQIVSGSFDASLKLWDVGSGNLVKDFKTYKPKEMERGHRDPVFSAAFSPDGKFLASGSGGLERVIKIWNVADGSVARDLGNPSIKVSAPPPVEEKIEPSKSGAVGAAAVAAIPKREPIPIVQSHPGWVYQLRFTSDGKYLISAGDAPLNKGFLAVWSPADGKMLYGETLPLGTFFGMAIAPDNRVIALGAGPRGRTSPEFNSAYLLKLQVMTK